MTRAELSESIRQFSMKWAKKGKEDEDDRSFWIDLFQRVLDVEKATDLLEFQKKVVVNNTTKKIDVYIPDTKVIIEQKSNNKSLDEKILQGDGEKLTPFEQAERYNNHLPHSEKARWIVTSNFKEIWIYDMDKNDREREPIKIELNALGDKHSLLKFLIKEEVKEITDEVAVSVKAGDIVGLIYDAFLEEYGDNPTEEDLKELNKLCVRLVFCLYAEDAGLFEDNAFHDYLQTWNVENMNSALEKLFDVLDTPLEKRRSFLDDRLKAFPYVNGELFKDKVEIPPITEKIKKLLLDDASRDFDWSKISPTIFGAVFESTLNPETRRSGGMHYTSVENIHKVINPLFMEELEQEYTKIVEEIKVPKTRITKLRAFQEKIAGLKFLDPACGSGNFLTETYLSLRKLENNVLKSIVDADKKQTDGQMEFGNVLSEANPIKVSINQFYGIEINDFAVTVARTAMWIAENQMMQETCELLFMDLDFLPLKSYTNIIEGNALRIDWNEVIKSNECNYIMGNPPFVGARLMTTEQKKDVVEIFYNWKKTGNLDYVSCWFKKAFDYIVNTNICVALVSTNSISQGDSVATLWKTLFEKGLVINFAYRTFRWDSEANIKAHVHCIIVGFTYKTSMPQKTIFENKERIIVSNINGYLMDGENVFVEARKKPLCSVPEIKFGSMPNDGGYLSDYSFEAKEIIVKEYPESEKFFKKIVGAQEFINNIERYCLWIEPSNLPEIKDIPPIYNAVINVRTFREKSKRLSTRKLAGTPYLFGEIRQPKTDYLLIPATSSQRRKYIPIGFMSNDVISNNANFVMENAQMYHFGILSSNVHMAWINTVAGRLKSDFRYSAKVVYNNFPWCSMSKEHKESIEKTANEILRVRNKYKDVPLAKLYDPIIMPSELSEAHRKNDVAVMRAYGFDVKTMTAESCVAKLMEMYNELVDLNKDK